MKRFCYGCKTLIEMPTQDQREFDKMFTQAGHSSQRVARMQRDDGRKQRSGTWQTQTS